MTSAYCILGASIIPDTLKPMVLYTANYILACMVIFQEWIVMANR